MNTEPIDIFVHQVMHITATTSGMGGAAAGVMGTTAQGDQTVYQLRKSTFAFAIEYRLNKPDKKRLAELGKEIEAWLQTLQMFSVITNEQFEQLRSGLQSLSA